MKRKHIFTGMLVFFWFVCLYASGNMVLYAADSGLTGEVSVIRTGDDFYVCQIQTENKGPEFEGAVRLFTGDMSDEAGTGCVFETPVRLPKGSKKQFTMTIPYEELDFMGGSGQLLFLDKSGQVEQTIIFEDIQTGKLKEVRVGVLCDHFDKLSYLESDENFRLVYDESSRQVRLVELNKDNLQDNLDSLQFLIIDSFDISTLKRQDIVAIENWVNMGGALIVGTGERGEETLSSFDSTFLGMEFKGSSNPPEENTISHEIATSKINPYYAYQSDGIDFTKMSVAEIAQTDAVPKRYRRNAISNPGILCSYGDGCTMVLYYSLCEEEMQKADNVRWFFFDEVMDECWSSFQHAFNIRRQSSGSLKILEEGNTHVPFAFFLVMALIYVVLSGPFLYLLLAKIKKRIWYWWAAPVFALGFFGITCFLGEPYRIKEPQVCSVTVQQADGKPGGKIHTSYRAFNSGEDPWEIKLNDNYQCVGPGNPGEGMHVSAVTDWKYRVVYEDGISLGFNPLYSFESADLFASGTGKDCGRLQADIPVFTEKKQTGTVINQTGYDFPYMMVWSDDYTMIIRDVKKGETIDLSQIAGTDRIIWTGLELPFDELQTQLPWFQESRVDLPTMQFAALQTGTADVMKQSDTFGNQVRVCGVVPDFDKTVKSKCTEVSYGCLYVVVAQKNSYTVNKPRH